MSKRSILSLLFLAIAAALVLSACATGSGAADGPRIDQTYLDQSLSAEARAESLLAQMTVAEKAGQMTQAARQYLLSTEHITRFGLGSILSGGGSAPRPNTVEAWREMTGGMQEAALATRLSIPLLYGNDSVHGQNNLLGAVIFPHHIGLGAANDEELMYEIARITTIESAATGVTWNFSPCIAVAMDIRWGRTYESFSSDPEIVSRLGLAETKGIQSGWGTSLKMLATPKHFVADGGTTEGDDQGNVVISEEDLESIHLFPYLASLKAGAATVMASYSSIDGRKMHANEDLLTGLLKDELQFDGFVISDWGAVKQLSGDPKAQIATAINAGIDMVMVPDDYIGFILNLTELIEEGAISMERIDDAVYRILLAKFRMGLFDDPMPDPSLEASVGSDEHRAVARQAVAASQVLLENDGILPLRQGQRVAVFGRAADSTGWQSGGWTLTWQGNTENVNPGTTFLEAIIDEAGEENVVYVVDPEEIAALDPESIDVAVVVGGERPYAEGQGDSRRPAVPRALLEGAAAFARIGVPVVSMIISGRPLLMDGLGESSNAIVASWLPGTEGGGVGDVLYGRVPFTGRLAFAWPKDESGFVQGQPDGVYRYPIGYGLQL